MVSVKQSLALERLEKAPQVELQTSLQCFELINLAATWQVLLLVELGFGQLKTHLQIRAHYQKRFSLLSSQVLKMSWFLVTTQP